MKLLGRRRPYHLIIDRPSGDLVDERIQLFAGFVQSNAPIPAFHLALNGVRQERVSRSEAGDPNAPWDRRHTAYWNVYCETARTKSRSGRIDLEISTGGRRVAHARFRCGAPHDRTTTGRPLVYLMHIPKTAGTTLRAALERRTPPLRLLHVYNNSAYLGIDQYRSFSPAASDDLDVVVGHFSYGLHTSSARPFKYVTVLRRPAAFVKSFYLFNKYGNRHVLAEFATIEEAIAGSGSGAFDNYFTRCFAGKIGGGPVTDADFAAAVRHMENEFAFVGHAEDMAGALHCIGTLLDVSLDLVTENMTPQTPEATGIDLDALDARFSEHWRYDARLCALAKQRFGPSRLESLGPLPAPPLLATPRLGPMRKLRQRLRLL